jgi:hypothetical protein
VKRLITVFPAATDIVVETKADESDARQLQKSPLADNIVGRLQNVFVID